MRRGLMSWSRAEVPEAALDSRVGKVQAALTREGMSAVLAYTSFAFPAAAHWLCNFTPYWSEGMVAVRRTGLPVLLASMTPRVHPWMLDISRLETVLSAPRLGPATAAWIREHTQPGDTVGLVGLDELPASVMRAIADDLGDSRRLVDATALLDGLRHPGDATEAGLARRAHEIARTALEARPADATRASEVARAAERTARLGGAEEVLLRMAPDLSKDATLQRLEGDFPLGPRFALEVSVAYKGVWTRLTESVSREAEPASWAQARQAFAALAAKGVADAGSVQALGPVTRWTCEAASGLHPLAVVAGSGHDAAPGVPPGTRGVLNVALALPEGPWLAAASTTLQVH